MILEVVDYIILLNSKLILNSLCFSKKKSIEVCLQDPANETPLLSLKPSRLMWTVTSIT